MNDPYVIELDDGERAAAEEILDALDEGTHCPDCAINVLISVAIEMAARCADPVSTMAGLRETFGAHANVAVVLERSRAFRPEGASTLSAIH